MKALAQYRLNREQHGGVLVMFVLLVFGLMAIAALVVDIGMASATQGQMQSAVDSAALEGMRWRNTLNNGVPDHIEVIPFFFEDDRRSNAASMVDMSFGGGDPTFTAGRSLEITGGVGEADALGLIEISDNDALSSPSIELNQGGSAGFNSIGGDMVAGTFDPYASHEEPIDYLRPDFAAAGSFDDANDATAFLVRLRRTGELPESGASWIGPVIPYLFGRGSLIRSSGTNSPRKDGIAVRATAIATAQPALQVGRSVDSPSGLKRGVARFAVEWSAWRDIEVTLNDPVPIEVDGNELLLAAGSVPIGRLMDLDPELRANKIGQRIEVLPGVVPELEPSKWEVWVPLYAPVSGVDRVIGFAQAEIGQVDEGGGSTEVQLVFSKRASDVASHNASAVFPASSVLIGEADWDEIFRLRRELVAHPRGEPLLASALSR